MPYTEYVVVSHPDVETTGRVPVESLPIWRRQGWAPVDEAPQGETPADDDAPDWTSFGASEVEAAGADADEESTS